MGHYGPKQWSVDQLWESQPLDVLFSHVSAGRLQTWVYGDEILADQFQFLTTGKIDPTYPHCVPNEMKFNIETGVRCERPTKPKLWHDMAETMKDMNVSQSFFVPFDMTNQRASHAQIQSAFSRAKKEATGKLFVSKKTFNNDGIRVWRLE